MYPKALASGADIVCVELEDGVAPKDKDAARANAIALFADPSSCTTTTLCSTTHDVMFGVSFFPQEFSVGCYFTVNNFVIFEQASRSDPLYR